LGNHPELPINIGKKGLIMKSYVALMRGINVGGRNVLPMVELTSILQGLGVKNVRSYIQSGNILFDAEDIETNALARTVSSVIEENKGFLPEMLILEWEKFAAAAAANPFPEAEDEPSKLHLAFAKTTPIDPDLVELEEVRTDSERFKLIDDVFYLHAPDGIGRSKLVTKIEKALGVPTTMRNWRTINKILVMGEHQSNAQKS
jgi:uncharacterized protein (DUF1697 family)